MKTCRTVELLGRMELQVSPHVLRSFGGWGVVVQYAIVTLGEEAACIVRAVSAGEAAHCGGVGLVEGLVSGGDL